MDMTLVSFKGGVLRGAEMRWGKTARSCFNSLGSPAHMARGSVLELSPSGTCARVTHAVRIDIKRASLLLDHLAGDHHLFHAFKAW